MYTSANDKISYPVELVQQCSFVYTHAAISLLHVEDAWIKMTTQTGHLEEILLQLLAPDNSTIVKVRFIISIALRVQYKVIYMQFYAC